MIIGIADYGMNVWDGGCFDYEERWEQLKEIGYDGIERITAFSTEEAVRKAARMRSADVHFGTVRGPSVELSIQWTAGLGRSYVWTEVQEKEDFNIFCRQVNRMTEVCERWGIHAALHNHMGTLVETQEQLERFLDMCPRTRLIFDTAHLAAMQGDCVEIVKKYANRLEVIHVKEWLLENKEAEVWHQRGRFCGLGKGNIGLDNIEVLKAALEQGFTGPVFVEHDIHKREPLQDLKETRSYLRQGGF